MYLRLNPYDEILQGIRVSLQVNEGIIKLTGKNGAGKTALCGALFEQLQANGQPAVLFAEPPQSALALQNTIVERLQLDPAGNFTRALTAWLHACNAVEKPLVLIFDDAQRLDPPTFSAIRMLCNIQSGAHGLVRVLLCGSGELDARIDGPALRAVTQFISQSFTLPYLTREQVRDFRQAYNLQRGNDMKAADERALDTLFRETKGQPGQLYARLEQESNAAAPAGMELPDFTEAEVLLAEHPVNKPGSLRVIAIAVVLMLVASASAYLYFVPQATGASTATAAVAPSPVGAPAARVAPQVNESTPAELAVDAAPDTEVASGSADVATGNGLVAEDVAPEAPAEEVPSESIVDEIPTETIVDEVPTETPVDDLPSEAASAVVAIGETSPEAPAGTASVGANPPRAPNAAPVEDFIASWIDSWQDQDVEAYLAHYHPEFAPLQGSRAAWDEQRRRVIANASGITISADAPQSNTEAQDGMRVVRFWLDYRAENYADRTLKELVLARVDGAWRIRVERNLRTEAR